LNFEGATLFMWIYQMSGGCVAMSFWGPSRRISVS